MEQEPLPDTVEADLGKVALSAVPIEWWWIEADNGDFPVYGAEILGEDF